MPSRSSRRAIALDGVPVGSDLDAFAKDVSGRLARINAGRRARGFRPVIVREPDVVGTQTVDAFGRLRATIVLDAKPMEDAIARLRVDMERRFAEAIEAESDAVVFGDQFGDQ